MYGCMLLVPIIDKYILQSLNIFGYEFMTQSQQFQRKSLFLIWKVPNLLNNIGRYLLLKIALVTKNASKPYIDVCDLNVWYIILSCYKVIKLIYRYEYTRRNIISNGPKNKTFLQSYYISLYYSHWQST